MAEELLELAEELLEVAEELLELAEELVEVAEELLEVAEEMKTCSHTQGLVRGEDVKDALRVFLGKVTQRQERRWLLSVSSVRSANQAFVKITILWFVRHVLNH